MLAINRNRPLPYPPSFPLKLQLLLGKLGVKTKEDKTAKIIVATNNNATITIPKLSELPELTDFGVQYHLTKMKKEGLLKHKRERKDTGKQEMMIFQRLKN